MFEFLGIFVAINCYMYKLFFTRKVKNYNNMTDKIDIFNNNNIIINIIIC